MTDPREDLLAGGLEGDGGSDIPVIHFTGIMAGYDIAEVEATQGGRKWQNVVHQVTELKVLETKEPFDFDSLEFRIPASKKQKSLWGIWVASVGRVLGIDLNATGVDGSPIRYVDIFNEHLDGKGVEIRRTGGHMLRRKDDETGKWAEKAVNAWELVSVEGAGKPPMTPEEEALRLLVSKGTDIVGFTQAVATNVNICLDSALVQAISGGTWIPAMVEAGKLVANGDGSYSLP